jgi:hypothetical protein
MARGEGRNSDAKIGYAGNVHPLSYESQLDDGGAMKEQPVNARD